MLTTFGGHHPMGRFTRSLAILGTALAVLLPLTAFAADSPPAQQGAMLANGIVTLGVSGDASIDGVGLGQTYVPEGSGLDWSIVSNPSAQGSGLTDAAEFSSNGVGAISSVVVQDSTGAALRVTHDFHPAATDPNLY